MNPHISARCRIHCTVSMCVAFLFIHDNAFRTLCQFLFSRSCACLFWHTRKHPHTHQLTHTLTLTLTTHHSLTCTHFYSLALSSSHFAFSCSILLCTHTCFETYSFELAYFFTCTYLCSSSLHHTTIFFLVHTFRTSCRFLFSKVIACLLTRTFADSLYFLHTPPFPWSISLSPSETYSFELAFFLRPTSRFPICVLFLFVKFFACLSLLSPLLHIFQFALPLHRKWWCRSSHTSRCWWPSHSRRSCCSWPLTGLRRAPRWTSSASAASGLPRCVSVENVSSCLAWTLSLFFFKTIHAFIHSRISFSSTSSPSPLTDLLLLLLLLLSSPTQVNAENEKEGGEKLFDSNCITPGTKFMDDLDRHLVYFIQRKVCVCVCVCVCVFISCKWLFWILYTHSALKNYRSLFYFYLYFCCLPFWVCVRVNLGMFHLICFNLWNC